MADAPDQARCYRCKADKPLGEFAMRTKKERYKTCDTCRARRDPPRPTARPAPPEQDNSAAQAAVAAADPLNGEGLKFLKNPVAGANLVIHRRDTDDLWRYVHGYMVRHGDTIRFPEAAAQPWGGKTFEELAAEMSLDDAEELLGDISKAHRDQPPLCCVFGYWYQRREQTRYEAEAKAAKAAWVAAKRAKGEPINCELGYIDPENY